MENPRNPPPEMTMAELHSALKGEIISSREAITTEIGGIKSELHQLKQDVDAVKDSQQFFNEKFEGFKANLTSLSGKVHGWDAEIAAIRQGHQQLSSNMAAVGLDLNMVQQEQLSNNMLISNVIKVVAENLPDLLKTICDTLGVTLMNRDVVSISRMTTKNTKQIEPILVRFSNRAVKDEIMFAAKSTALSCRQLGFAIDQRIYFNHHLTTRNQTIMQAARQYKRKYNFRFVWFTRGSIYIKRDETSPAIRITSTHDLPAIDLE